MDPPASNASQSAAVAEGDSNAVAPSPARSGSFSSHKSDDSQTAADFIRNQMQLEADAREALPYSIENCTKILGPLRQSVFACLTCTPPPHNPSDPFSPAGVCYACSVQCHGDHSLVEIFTKRNFTCDCGTTRLPAASTCDLRVNPSTNTKGGVHSEEPDANNKYNQNFRNRFCGCECDYNPFQQKGTMFQCLGLGTTETGGCGEDWYHPGCLVGMGPSWFESMKKEKPGKDTGAPRAAENTTDDGSLPTISEEAERQQPPREEAPTNQEEEEETDDDDDDPPMPPGFPSEDDFEGFLCYKCVAAYPWIRRYAGTKGFLPAVFTQQDAPAVQRPDTKGDASNKRKAAEDPEDASQTKRVKSEQEEPATKKTGPAETSSTEKQQNGEAANGQGKQQLEPEKASTSTCRWATLPNGPDDAPFSIFFTEFFRDHLCRCSDCYVSKLNAHSQLLEEEETYEPPLSEDGGSEHGGSTHGSGSLLERGESALRNVDRVRAIEGVMAYNHLKEQLKPFFREFADSGRAIGAEDIKAYFAKLRGDDQGIREAGGSRGEGDDDDHDNRREQSGY
ncbi:hypothetical protein SODALDRAFT_307690 [Sodiomyces alkalinus F11]|uniref:UBR-type domain-containing protein n=1 Tax=Sodiomyces alkalinus (strain CBS 110278 / VKM F-3762 / F11) TaxID=1314773 RepID=A0A3N2Q376_SODAK|nr:hypothetical protein SODALDRAFT_307690 [Sodiomyces alkalinus F11]ROT41128.1 hypothetical protein SODALDRAFT_307690 [Sodiomyces alkalinus F11]